MDSKPHNPSGPICHACQHAASGATTAVLTIVAVPCVRCGTPTATARGTPDPRDAELAALRARLAACERFAAACAQLDRFEAADDRARVAWAVDHARALGALPRKEW